MPLLIKPPGGSAPRYPPNERTKQETKKRPSGSLDAVRLRVGGLAGTVRPQPWAVSSIGPPGSANPARFCFVPGGVVTPSGTTKIAKIRKIQEIRTNFDTPGILPADSAAFRRPDDQRSTRRDPRALARPGVPGTGRRNLDPEASASHQLPGTDTTCPGDALPGDGPWQQVEDMAARAPPMVAEDHADSLQGVSLGGCELK